LATEKGESGAEAIALEIGAYMGEVSWLYDILGGLCPSLSDSI
jgi:hypothetical protein